LKVGGTVAGKQIYADGEVGKEDHKNGENEVGGRFAEKFKVLLLIG
jgi:hypothetical protein